MKNSEKNMLGSHTALLIWHILMLLFHTFPFIVFTPKFKGLVFQNRAPVCLSFF